MTIAKERENKGMKRITFPVLRVWRDYKPHQTVSEVSNSLISRHFCILAVSGRKSGDAGRLLTASGVSLTIWMFLPGNCHRLKCGVRFLDWLR